jgi:copper(I)-binding protein
MPLDESSDPVSHVARRRLTAVSLTAIAGLSLTACGTSFGAQTNQVYQPAVGTNVRGQVESHNTLLVANRDGSATLSAAVVSNLKTEQTLTGVTVTDQQGKALTVRKPKAALTLPSRALTTIGGEDPDSVFIVAEGAEPGDYVDVTYTFSDSSELVVDAPVVARAEHAAEYEDVAGGDGIVPKAVSGTEAE